VLLLLPEASGGFLRSDSSEIAEGARQWWLAACTPQVMAVAVASLVKSVCALRLMLVFIVCICLLYLALACVG
jgi:hypothetical protein